MYEKSKKFSFQRWHHWNFLVFWTIGNVFAFGVFFWLMDQGLGDFVDDFPETLESIVLGTLIAVFLGVAQTILLHNQLNIQEKLWLQLTMLGGGIGFVVATEAFNYFDSRVSDNSATMLAWFVLMVSMSATQWVALRKYFHTAWLWLLASGVGSIVFVTVLQMFEDDYGYEPYLIVVTTIGQFLVMGVMLLWLVGNARKNLKNDEKLKIEYA